METLQGLHDIIPLIGIPVRNGVSHVREIARMSLRLMETVKVIMMVTVMVMVMVMVMVIVMAMVMVMVMVLIPW